jgi:hypothetical protein
VTAVSATPPPSGLTGAHSWQWHRVYFEYAQSNPLPFGRRPLWPRFEYYNGSSGGGDEWGIWFSPGSLALMLLVLPGLWLRRYARQRSRHDRGLCPTCGYDLRATPERCPECGTAVKAAG